MIDRSNSALLPYFTNLKTGDIIIMLVQSQQGERRERERERDWSMTVFDILKRNLRKNYFVTVLNLKLGNSRRMTLKALLLF